MKIPADLCVLVADYGVGDHYIVAGFAAGIRQRYGLRTWMAGKAKLAFLSGLFPAAERYLNWPDNVPPSQITERQIRGGAYFHAHFPGLELMRAVGYGNFHFLDAYRCRFGLLPGAPLTAARRPTAEQVAAAASTLRHAGLDPAELILISPEARTTPVDGVEPAFWAGLSAELRAAGFRPLFNAGPGAVLPEGADTLSCSLEEVRPIAQACAGVCSIRSGFSDLVCDLPVPQVVIYPNASYWAGSLLQGTTFDRYDLPQPPRELVVTPASAEARARETAEHFVLSRQLAPASGAA